MKNSKNKTTETQVVNTVVEKVISKSDVCRELVMKQSDITLKYVNQELTKRGFNTMYYSELLRVKVQVKKMNEKAKSEEVTA
jgi:hypothetical protein